MENLVKVELQPESPELMIVKEVHARKKANISSPMVKPEPQIQPHETTTPTSSDFNETAEAQTQPTTTFVADQNQPFHIDGPMNKGLENITNHRHLPWHITPSTHVPQIISHQPSSSIEQTSSNASNNMPPSFPESTQINKLPTLALTEAELVEKAGIQKITLSLETLLKLANVPSFNELVSGCFARIISNQKVVKLAYIQYAFDMNNIVMVQNVIHNKRLNIIHTNNGGGQRALHLIVTSNAITDEEFREWKKVYKAQLPVAFIDAKEAQIFKAISELPQNIRLEPAVDKVTRTHKLHYLLDPAANNKVEDWVDLAPCFLTRSQILNLLDAKVPEIVGGCYVKKKYSSRSSEGEMTKIVHSSLFPQQSGLQRGYNYIFRFHYVSRVSSQVDWGDLNDIEDEPLTNELFTKWIVGMGLRGKTIILPSREYVAWKANQLEPFLSIMNKPRPTISQASNAQGNQISGQQSAVTTKAPTTPFEQPDDDSRNENSPFIPRTRRTVQTARKCCGGFAPRRRFPINTARKHTGGMMPRTMRRFREIGANESGDELTSDEEDEENEEDEEIDEEEGEENEDEETVPAESNGDGTSNDLSKRKLNELSEDKEPSAKIPKLEVTVNNLPTDPKAPISASTSSPGVVITILKPLQRANVIETLTKCKIDFEVSESEKPERDDDPVELRFKDNGYKPQGKMTARRSASRDMHMHTMDNNEGASMLSMSKMSGRIFQDANLTPQQLSILSEILNDDNALAEFCQLKTKLKDQREEPIAKNSTTDLNISDKPTTSSASPPIVPTFYTSTSMAAQSPLLPSSWSLEERSDCITCFTATRIVYTGEPLGEQGGVGWVRTNRPIPTEGCKLYYFEITVLKAQEMGSLGVGLCWGPADLIKGWAANSVCFNSNGLCTGSSDSDFKYGEKFAVNDTIGCGLDLEKRELFFTKNGHCLGPAQKEFKITLPIFPTVSLGSLDESVEANFGTDLVKRPFMWTE